MYLVINVFSTCSGYWLAGLQVHFQKGLVEQILITHTILFPSLAQRYFLEKHDWSHEEQLPSCRAKPVMSDSLQLMSHSLPLNYETVLFCAVTSV